MERGRFHVSDTEAEQSAPADRPRDQRFLRVVRPSRVSRPLSVGRSATGEKHVPQRITHMLVLIDRNPAKGEAAFIQGMLGWLYSTTDRICEVEAPEE